MPTGLSFNTTTGQVTGTPTATYATHNVSFGVLDSQNNSSTTTVAVSFTVNQPLSAVANTTTSLTIPQNSAMLNFSTFTSVTGGYTPYVYSITSGSLPTGVTLNSSTGVISGTPTVNQSNTSVTISVQDNQSTVAANTETFGLKVLGTYVANMLLIGGGGAPGTGYISGGGGAGGSSTFGSYTTYGGGGGYYVSENNIEMQNTCKKVFN